MTLQYALNALSSLVAIACAGGLLLNMAAQPSIHITRTTSAQLLATLCIALLLWAFVGVALFDVPLETRVQAAASAMTLAVLIYFVFLNRAIRSGVPLASLLTLAAPVIFVANLLLIWFGGSAIGEGIAFIILTVYAAAAFWLVMISRDDSAPPLRIASLIAIVACASPLLVVELIFSDALLLMGVAVGWVGWLVLRDQMQQPLTALRAELRIANGDLRQATSEAASLRSTNNTLNAELQAAGQYRSDFLDQLGHKLRTPLNSISGYSELLQSGLYGDLNEVQGDRLEKIQRNSNTLLDVISNMLDLNKINAGRLELTRDAIAINPMITEILEPLQAIRSTRLLTLETNLAPALPPIYGDKIRICQVITQMIDNAHRFTFSGGITISTRFIQVRNGESAQFALPVIGWLADGDWVLVEVSDTGIGIALENQARIFDAFYQVADPRADEYFGTGLGLTIAKRLTELHEGALWLKSTPEKGSTFYLALHPQQVSQPRAQESMQEVSQGISQPFAQEAAPQA